MSHLAVAVQVLLALVFLESLATHLRDRDRFHGVLARLGVTHVTAVARVMQGIEFVILLTVLALPIEGAIIAGSYVFGVTALLVIKAKSGDAIDDCGCSEVPKPVDRRFVLRNAFLIFSALALVGIGHGSPSPMFAFALTAIVWSARRFVFTRSRDESQEPLRLHDDHQTRRGFLEAGARGAAALVTLPLLNRAIPTSSSDAREGAQPIKDKQTRIGVGEDLPEVAEVKSNFATLDETVASTVASGSVYWRLATLFREEFEDAHYTSRKKLLVAPIVSDDGRVQGTLLKRWAEDVRLKPNSRYSEVTVFETVQLNYQDGGERMLLHLDETGTTEVRSLPNSPGNDADSTPLNLSDVPCDDVPEIDLGRTCSDSQQFLCLHGCLCRMLTCCTYRVCKCGGCCRSLCCYDRNTVCQNSPWFLCGIPCCNFWC